jgi:hypothetical protein
VFFDFEDRQQREFFLFWSWRCSFASYVGYVLFIVIRQLFFLVFVMLFYGVLKIVGKYFN